MEKIPVFSIWEEYMRVRNKANSMAKKDSRRYRKKILQGFKGKPKRFFSFMRSLQTVKERVVALIADSGNLTSSDQQAAEVL